MKVKAVLFDLGGTLIKTAEVPEIFRRILAAYGIRVSRRDILKAHRLNQADSIDVAAGQIELGMAFWKDWNLKILEKLGIKRNSEFLAENISRLWWDHADLEFFPDVVETITKLRARGIKVGIITNGLREDYEEILHRLKATGLFDIVVGSDTCRKAKPDKQIFMYTINQLGVSPKETLFVGDDVKRDYEGAVKAGLKSFLIDRGKKGQKNVAKITSLTELLSHLE